MAQNRGYLLTYGSAFVASVAAGTGVYTMTSDNQATPFYNPIDWIKVGIQIRVYGCTNAANNGIFTVTAVAGSVITTSNAASVLENPSTAGRIGYPVGGTTDNILTDISTQMVGYDTAEVVFKFEVADQTEATFVSKVLAAESVFRTPRRDFSWLNGATDILPFKASDATGFDAAPVIEKREDKHSGRSRVFTVSIRFGLPADVVHTAGRRYATINVSYSPSRRRRVTITGVYTRVSPGTTTSRAQYEANIDTYALTVLTGLGLSASTAELGEEPSTVHNETNMTLEFTRVYDEIIFGQGGGVNDSAIVRQSLRVSRKKVAPGDTPTCNRLATLSVSYDAWIDKTVTTDLKGKYDSIRSWIITTARATQGGAVALVDDTPSYDYDDNKISASLTLLCVTGGNVFENTVTTETYDQYGGVLVSVWDGNPLSKYDYQGPARKMKTITHTWKEIGGSSSPGQSSSGVGLNIQFGQGSGVGVGISGGFSFPGGGGIDIFGPASGAATSALAAAAQGLPDPNGGANAGPGVQGENGLSMIPVDWRNSSTPKEMGLDGYTIQFTEYVSTQTFEYFVKPSGGSGGNPPVASGQGQSGFGLGSS